MNSFKEIIISNIDFLLYMSIFIIPLVAGFFLYIKGKRLEKAENDINKVLTKTTYAKVININEQKVLDNSSGEYFKEYFTYRCVFEFTINNITYKEPSHYSTQMAPEYPLGYQKVPVKYDPNNPENFSIIEKMNTLNDVTDKWLKYKYYGLTMLICSSMFLATMFAFMFICK